MVGSLARDGAKRIGAPRNQVFVNLPIGANPDGLHSRGVATCSAQRRMGLERSLDRALCPRADRPALVVLRATAAEREAHRERLALMGKGGSCLWPEEIEGGASGAIL